MQEEQRLAASDSQGSSDAADQPSVDQSTADDTDKTVVRLNTATEGTPLFIFHGAGGGILVLRKMAEKLDFPVFGVQDTQDAPITGALERLAEFYLSKIVEKQANGPYRLGGFSFGMHSVIMGFIRLNKVLRCRYMPGSRNGPYAAGCGRDR